MRSKLVTRWITVGHSLGFVNKETYRLLRGFEYKEKFTNSLEFVYFFETNAKGTIIYAGTKALEEFGYDESALNNISIFDVVHPNERKSLKDMFQNIADGQNPKNNIRRMMLREDGSVFPGKIHAIRKTHKDGSFAGVRGVVVNDTEQFEIEEKLKKSNTQKDKLFSIISHDLKSPFNALIGFSELLCDEYGSMEEETIKDTHKIMKNAAKKAFVLLENLLAWSRSQTHKLPINIERLVLEKEIQSVVTISVPSAKLKGVTIQDKSNGDKVLADKESLQLILRNLLTNAIKFTPKGGHISIYTKTVGSFVEISISDTGVGIDSQNLKKIFNNEELFSTKGTDNESGTGLGLPTCKELAKQQNGEIIVESELNKGSTFILKLPSAE